MRYGSAPRLEKLESASRQRTTGKGGGLAVSLFRSDSELVDGLFSAPNPKPSKGDKARFGQLASLYTSYSQAFAADILDLCIREGCRTFADPFSGMGTIGEAGRDRPVELLLGDISPFAALSGLFRTSPREDILSSAALVEGLASQIEADNERSFFADLLSAAGAGIEMSTRHVLKAPTEPENRTPALAMYLAALSRLSLHKSLSGSNPTWIKRAKTAADEAATRDAVARVLALVRTYAEGLSPLNPRNRASVMRADVSDLEVADGSIDAVITSPPYPNRTDYIRHYLPASELLISAAGEDERRIRQAQIGTPLIRQAVAEPPLPASVTQMVSRIKAHPSYASERYYYKGFLYYFSDMTVALGAMERWLRPGGMIILVVQDTYYKDVHVPVADLLSDVARLHRLTPVTRRDWRVSNTLSQLSPHSRRVVPNRTLSESVVIFSK